MVHWMQSDVTDDFCYRLKISHKETGCVVVGTICNQFYSLTEKEQRNEIRRIKKRFYWYLQRVDNKTLLQAIERAKEAKFAANAQDTFTSTFLG